MSFQLTQMSVTMRLHFACNRVWRPLVQEFAIWGSVGIWDLICPVPDRHVK